jgi:hypothetical protein
MSTIAASAAAAMAALMVTKVECVATKTPPTLASTR